MPSNLIVDRDDKIWVTDFGLARCRRAGSGDRDGITGSGAIIGTVRYMSPEQAAGNPGVVDHRSDIYSLGVTLHEMLCGTRLSGNEAVKVRRLNPRVSRDLETVLMKSMAADPAERYPTALEFAEDLQRVLGSRPILARRPSLADRITKWTLRHRRGACLSAIIVLIALAVSLASASKFSQQKSALQSALLQADQNLHVADHNLQQAEANFRQTREVLDHFGLMAAERLRGVAGAETLREDLVRDLLKYYERFADEFESADDLQTELAQTHLRAAKIIEEIGATRKALTAYERAAVILAKLPPSPVNDYELALCQNSIAMLHAQHGEDGQAESIYRNAIERLTAINRPGTLATVRGNLGLLLSSMDREKEARKQFEIAINEVSGEPDNDTSQALTTAMLWNNLSHLAQDEDLARSLQLNQNAIDVLREVKAPDHETDRALAMSLSNQAAILTRLDRLDQATLAYQESTEVFGELVERLPMAVRHSEELAITYNNFGRLLHRLSRDQEARYAMTQARNLMQSLVQRRPGETRYREALASMKSNLETFAP